MILVEFKANGQVDVQIVPSKPRKGDKLCPQDDMPDDPELYYNERVERRICL